MDLQKAVATAIRPLLALSMMLACGQRSTPAPTPAPTAEPTRASAPALTPDVEQRQRGSRHYEIQRFNLALSETDVDYVDLEFERALDSALDEPQALLVINGGFWSPEGEPEGLSVDGSGTRSEYDEDLGGGVLVITNDRVAVHDGETFEPGLSEASSVRFAIQAKPRLVVRGVLNIARDDGRFADRTGLCVPADATRLVVVIARGNDSRARSGPSLFEFGQDLVELGCREALNLDGGPSTGVAYRSSPGVVAQEPRTRVRLAVRFSAR